MTNKNGGYRKGAGRKSTYPGEKTKSLRIPESQIQVVQNFLEAYRQRQNDKLVLTTDERFSYELEIGHLKKGLLDAIHYLNTYFDHIPVVRQKSVNLKKFLEAPKKTKLKKTSFSTWKAENYNSAGAAWELSGIIEAEEIILRSTPPEKLPDYYKNTDPHSYKLSLQTIETLIDFLLEAKNYIDELEMGAALLERKVRVENSYN